MQAHGTKVKTLLMHATSQSCVLSTYWATTPSLLLSNCFF